MVMSSAGASERIAARMGSAKSREARSRAATRAPRHRRVAREAQIDLPDEARRQKRAGRNTAPGARSSVTIRARLSRSRPSGRGDQDELEPARIPSASADGCRGSAAGAGPRADGPRDECGKNDTNRKKSGSSAAASGAIDVDRVDEALGTVRRRPRGIWRDVPGGQRGREATCIWRGHRGGSSRT